MPVDWIVSGSPSAAGGPRVAPEAAVVVEHQRLDEQRLGERQCASGIARQQHALGQRGGGAQVDRLAVRRTPAERGADTLARGGSSADWDSGSGCDTGRDFRLRPMATSPNSDRAIPRTSAAENAPPSELTLKQVAARAGVTPATVTRWVKEGLVPQYEGDVDAGGGLARADRRAAARARAHVQRIREASQSGKLAFGYIDELLPSTEARYTLERGGARDRPGARR